MVDIWVPWRGRGLDSQEQCIRKLTLLYGNIVAAADDISGVLPARKAETSSGPLVLSTFEERLIVLVRSQQDMAHEVSGLKAIMVEPSGRSG